MNIMILSPGRRVEIIKYFKEAFNKVGGKVITVDMSSYAPALYEGDLFFKVNKDFNNLEKYIDDIIILCKKNNVNAILTLIDPELVLLAKYEEKFKRNGISIIISEKEIIDDTFDKYTFYKKYNAILPLLPTFYGYEEVLEALENKAISFPLFAKIRTGSGSAGIGQVSNLNELLNYKEKDNFIFQPSVKVKEFGVDVYFDLENKKIVKLFMKEKLSMRSGETDKAISVYNEQILEIIKKLEKIGKFKGQIDVDIFEDCYGNFYINEINPRFGGGYAHAHNCGVNFIDCIVNNIKNITNEKELNNYEKGIVMMKFNGLIFRNKENIL